MKKVVNIKENHLVELMMNIVSETVAKEKAQLLETEKKKWIAEQRAENKKLLESKDFEGLKKKLLG
jgi:hypothetical protein